MLLTAFANTVSLVNLNISTKFNLKFKFIARITSATVCSKLNY